MLRFWTDRQQVKTISSTGKIKVLNGNYEAAKESKEIEIGVLYINDTKEMIVLIDGEDKGRATINATKVYGCIFVKAKNKASVLVSSKAGKSLAIS